MITFTIIVAVVLVALFIVDVTLGLIAVAAVIAALLVPAIRRFLTARTQSASYLVRR